MSGIVTINDTELQVIEHRGQRVATLAQVDAVHGRPDGTARRTFNDHKHRLVEGEDYFVRNAYEAREMGFTAPNGLILVTEQGYTMLVKPFTDDLAWQVQRQVVTGYYRGKEAALVRQAEAAKAPRVSERYREAAAIAQASIKLCKLMGVETNMARVITADLVNKESGVDCTPMLSGNIAVQEVPVTPSKLGASLNPALGGKKVNALLVEAGLQVRNEDGSYVLTEAGKEFGVMEPFKSQHSQHVGHRPMWYLRASEPIRLQMAKQSNVVSLQSAA
ncbi:ORF6N domain-containing protein [Acidovorax sp. BL-A-41-H1]|uniref:ORF6N domain-containing protein n=1 Tax=Acidovorax sp. BL-A-41-H1 TaxID=3421102 RepID=UPI003F78D7FE